MLRPVADARRPQRPVGGAFLPALVILAVCWALAGCGTGSSEPDRRGATTPAASEGAGPRLAQRTKAVLVLDFLPNAVHAGIYRALAAGYYKDNNIDLRIIPPSSTSDTLKLIDAGRADFGIADGIDLATQIDAGRSVKAIAALVQRPLGGIITTRSSGITDPARFEGRIVGITGVPSDSAVLDTIVGHAGGDPAKVRRVTIGFNGVQNLENGKIDGFVGFYAADGAQVVQNGQPVRSFPFDENGGPRYPGLVVFSGQGRISDSAPLMRAFLDATARGYDDTDRDPLRSLDDLLSQVPSLKRPLTAAQLRAYEPLFVAGAPRWGQLDGADLRALSDFLVEAKLIKRPIAPARFGTNDLLPVKR